MINSTKIAMQPVEISYISSSSDKSSDSNKSSDDDADAAVVLQKWVEGTAIKLSETKWQVILSDGSIVETEQNDLLDSSKFFVKKALNRVSIAEERKAAQKVKRRRQIEHKAQEAVMLESAREERRKRDKEEFEKMSVSIAAGTESGNPYDFKDFEELLLRLRAPFKTTIDGFAITVAENDAVIMMEDAALEVVKKRILGENKRKKNDDDTTTNNNKKQ